MSSDHPGISTLPPDLSPRLRHELEHLQSHWWWLLVLGIVLALAGSAVIAVPAATVLTTFAVVIALGITMVVAGSLIIVGSFWAGKWSGFLLNLLVGLLYVVAGFAIADVPQLSVRVITLVLASMFIVLGSFRAVAALTYRFPQWGWMLLNGGVTLLLGLIIFKHFQQDAAWVIGLLVGIEMLFNGWTWIMLALAVRRAPRPLA